jgi:hypothetical protein
MAGRLAARAAANAVPVNLVVDFTTKLVLTSLQLWVKNHSFFFASVRIYNFSQSSQHFDE